MSYQQQVEDTVVLLSAHGVTGTPNEMKTWAEQAMNNPKLRIRLAVDLLRSYGANLEAAA